jgi:hypothetical protein
MFFSTTRNLCVLRKKNRLPLATRTQLLVQMGLPHEHLGLGRRQSNQGTSMEEEVSVQTTDTSCHTNQTSIYEYNLSTYARNP